jgi:Glycosyltransferase family 87
MRSRGRAVAAGCIVAAGFLFVTLLFALSVTDEKATKSDFIGYWAAGKQIVRDASPYDEKAVLQLEEQLGLGTEQMKITPSPPAGLSLVVPLGFFSARAGLVLWTMAQFASLACSVWILWIVQGRPQNRIHLLGFLFAPALACIMAGQLGVFFLLGVALFLLLHESRPFIAGLALLPCSLKPHLFLPVVVALILWSVWRKAPRILAGFVVAALVSDVVVLYFDPHIWSQYREMMATAGLHDRFAPTLAAELRLHLAPRNAWLQYVPMAAACAWAGWYYWTRRNQWKWLDHGMMVLLVSVLCTPYSWFTDESVLLTAVLAGVYRALESRRSLVPVVLIAIGALVELYANVRITAWYYMWTAPAWLAWFVYATRGGAITAKQPEVLNCR